MECVQAGGGGGGGGGGAGCVWAGGCTTALQRAPAHEKSNEGQPYQVNMHRYFISRISPHHNIHKMGRSIAGIFPTCPFAV